MLSLITTCKNRLPHLKQTLPLMLRQPRAEVIVVDYGCEQGTAAWVKENHPAAKLVEVNDDPVFCLARARNLGAKEASHDLLCFIDADVLLHQDLVEWLDLNQKPNGFYMYPEPAVIELFGFVIVPRKHFFRIAGYDEAFSGWGGEDTDLYERLMRVGLSQFSVSKETISPILHGDELRQFGKDAGGVGSRWEALAIQDLYMAIKRDSWKLTNREIELEKRKELLEFIKLKRDEAMREGLDAFEVSINVPMHSSYNILRGLSYRTPTKRPTR
jgi:glycosyltransferase involved in cell wall biosynthesis